MPGCEQWDNASLAKSLRQSWPYRSVHVAGGAACRLVFENTDSVVLGDPSSCLGLGSSFLFYAFFLLRRVPRCSQFLWGQKNFWFIWWLLLGGLLGGCISLVVPSGHQLTTLLVAFAVDDCHLLWFPYYFQKFQDFGLVFNLFSFCCKKSSFLVQGSVDT